MQPTIAALPPPTRAPASAFRFQCTATLRLGMIVWTEGSATEFPMPTRSGAIELVHPVLFVFASIWKDSNWRQWMQQCTLAWLRCRHLLGSGAPFPNRRLSRGQRQIWKRRVNRRYRRWGRRLQADVAWNRRLGTTAHSLETTAAYLQHANTSN